MYTVDDREIVATIVAGDPAGLAEAYDQHAESVYGYIRWMLDEPAEAADALRDTYIVAASRLRGLTNPSKLRPWLYAVARNECQRRLTGTKPGAGLAMDMTDPDEDPEQEELRRLVQAALSRLSPGAREAIELDLQHDMHGADLGAILGLPRFQAQDLVSGARGKLEKELGALLVARAGRHGCPDLDMLLDDWDNRMTVLTRKRVGRHLDRCRVCASLERGMLRRSVLFGMPPLAALPAWLGEDVLELCTDWGPEAIGYRQEVVDTAGPFRPSGFPEPLAAPRRRMPALSGLAGAAGVAVALTATGIVTVVALTGSSTPHHPQAARSPSETMSASSSSTTPDSSGVITTPKLPTQAPSTSQPATSAPPPAVVATSASPARPKPSPPHPVTTSAAPTPSVTPAISFSAGPTVSASPATTPPTAPSPSLSPTVTPATPASQNASS